MSIKISKQNKNLKSNKKLKLSLKKQKNLVKKNIIQNKYNFMKDFNLDFNAKKKKIVVVSTKKNYIDNTKVLKRLIQQTIKKGNKSTIEKLYRKLLNEVALKGQKSFWKIMGQTLFNSMPYVTVSSKRKGSQNILMLKKITRRHRYFLAHNTIIESAKKRSNKFFYQKLTDELFATFKGQSNTFKKRNELHKLAEENYYY